MISHFLLYISAANDMEAERDLLARAVIDVPADVAWRIEQSPRANEPVDQEAIAQADLHLLLLGSDIRAPIGLEWLAARRFGRWPIPLLKSGAGRTLAAEDFRLFIARQRPWQPFASAAQLQKEAQRLLGRSILDQAISHGLSPEEMVDVQRWLTAVEEASEAEIRAPGGAGESSFIFSKERHEPTSGILLRPGEGGDDAMRKS